MKVLVTGSSGHLGEALVRTLQHTTHEVVSLDRLGSPFTQRIGSITDRAVVKECMQGVTVVLHTATLHKPHVATHSRQAFVDTNITGTLNLLEEAIEAGVDAFIFTSTTSVFGSSLIPPPAAPAAWITEDVRPTPKNIYGVTKTAAEDLCELFHRLYQIPCLVLRTSRFFSELDDDPDVRQSYDNDNLKVNEYLHRRVDVQDVVDALLLAIEKAPGTGFGRYIISATTPFLVEDLPLLRQNVQEVVRRRVPEYEEVYKRLGWKMFPTLDRVYVNDRARRELGWQPKYDFQRAICSLKNGEDFRSPLARVIGSKGYHGQSSLEGAYPGS